MTIAETFNKYLRALYDTEDALYKILIADPNGVPAPVVTQPQDVHIGAIASTFEWVRQLAKSLVLQLFLNQATGKFLDFLVHNHIGIVRYEGESDDSYRHRVQVYIIAPKVSRAAILYYTRPFSSPNPPAILDGLDDAPYADLTFADVYESFQNEAPGPEYLYWVFPAITLPVSASAYFFILQLENTPLSEVPAVLNLVDRWVAGGISYEIQIVRV